MTSEQVAELRAAGAWLREVSAQATSGISPTSPALAGPHADWLDGMAELIDSEPAHPALLKGQALARRRVNYLIEIGRLTPPNAVPCADCGHQWAAGERRHEYDHHLGYAAEHHEDVEAVCTTCHHAREAERRAA